MKNSGYSKKEVEQQLHWYDFVESEDLKRMQHYHQQRSSHTGNPPQDYDCRIRTKQGQQKTVHVRIAMIPETNDRIVSLLDVSQIEQLKQDKTMLINSMTELFCYYTTDLKILWANKAAAQSVGKKVEEMTGQHCYNLWNQSDEVCKECIMPKVLETGKPQSFEKQTPDGRWWLINGYPVFDDEGKVKNLIEMGLDITERKKTQEKYQRYVDNSPDGIFIADRQGRYLEVNEAASKITGYSKEELTTISIAEITAPESKQQALESFQNLLDIGHTSGENIFIHKDGTRHYWQVNAVKISEERFIGFVRDITNRVKMEEEIKLKNQQLDKANQLKSNFLNVTSHELRTPMTAITGYLQMLNDQILGEISSEQKDAIDIILRNASRLDRLVDDILDTSRLESGTMKFIPKEAEIEPLIDELQQTMKSEAELKKIALIKNIQENLPNIVIDQDRVKQVFINLIKNAIKFSPKHTTITIEAQRDNDMVLFKVRDEGRGIPADHQQKIFDVFYQVESGLDRSIGGTGLGLCICRGIIICHGGKIWVESEEGKGSTFYFNLPLEPVMDAEGTFKEFDVFNIKK